jgi:hypothetical protein
VTNYNATGIKNPSESNRLMNNESSDDAKRNAIIGMEKGAVRKPARAMSS